MKKRSENLFLSVILLVKCLILHTIKNIMTDAEYEELVDYFKDIFDNTIKYTYEFYVSDGTVIKQAYKFEGSITEPGTNSSGEMKIYVDVNYNNIGETFEILVPK